MAKYIAVADDGLGQSTYVHKKCGAKIVLVGDEQKIPDDQNCPVCLEILKDWKENRVQRATVGTPIADEIGQVFRAGEIGVTKS